MSDIDNPKGSNAVPVKAFYADRIPFIVPSDVCGVIDLYHGLALIVYICQSLSKCFRTVHPYNVTPVRVVGQTQKQICIPEEIELQRHELRAIKYFQSERTG